MSWSEELWRAVTRDILPNSKFTLEWAYAQAPGLQKLHPENHAVMAKIRQTLGDLVEKGLIERLSPGLYRRRTTDEVAATWVERT